MRVSSPLTRGKQERERVQPLADGLIPAHAEKTRPATCRALDIRAHPRSHGENLGVFHRGRGNAGSSPLTQGKHTQVNFLHPPVGLIPAHAGKTTIPSTVTWTGRAHPHSRGENIAACMSSMVAPGSSPLTRGTQVAEATPFERSGLIPTHAGKTVIPGQAGRSRWAHPRSRGENARQTRDFAAQWGSSPLARGKRDLRARRGPRLRLIPAHAGKTGRTTVTKLPSGAHPRSRGENTAILPRGTVVRGLSPLTWGKL